MLRPKRRDEIEGVKREVEAALAEAARVPPSLERLEAVKSNLRYAFAQQLKTPLGTAFTLSEFLWLTGDPSSLSRHVQALSRVGPRDVMRVADRYFHAENRSVVTLSAAEGKR